VDDEQLYFEDVPLNRPFVTTGRTVTEADVLGFAGLSADFNPLHVDAHYAATTPFGGRVAHGLLVLAIASGMTTRLPIMLGLNRSLLGMTEVTCRWPAPTRIGDSIRVELTFTDKTPTRSGTRGLVTERRRVLNNHNSTVVLESEWKLLVATREQPGRE
jgi:acyl dehydratase